MTWGFPEQKTADMSVCIIDLVDLPLKNLFDHFFMGLLEYGPSQNPVAMSSEI